MTLDLIHYLDGETPSRHKDVAKMSLKRLIFGLKDVLDWSEMDVATTFF